MPLSVATWNVNSLRVRLEHVRKWTADNPTVDVLCLQETKVEDDKFPHDALAAAGWEYRAIWGQKTYNGVAILSKKPIADVTIGLGDDVDDPQARIIAGRIDGVRIYCCYIPNGNEVGSPKFRYKLKWLRRLRATLDRCETAEDAVLVCGDFNIAPDKQDTYDPWEAENGILFHPLEHKALSRVTAWGLRDALRELEPESQRFSWWDYRFSGFKRNIGFRIDHIWITDPLVQRLTEVQTHRDVRGWEQPSDHVPVVATFGD